MSNITATGEEGSFSSGNNNNNNNNDHLNSTTTGDEEVIQGNQQKKQIHFHGSNSSIPSATTTLSTNSNDSSSQQPVLPKKKRNLPGTPDPNAEVIALSPTTLMATNRFVCEICNKGFQRDQNLQLHRRGHNLPWKLRQRTTTEVKKRVYICPEPTCVHHNPARALGDLTGIKKHFSRKHGEKKWKCDKCSKKYAVQSDWKAHQKTCGTREYKCDCGTIFSRRDSFITHRAFCDALAEENNKVNQGLMNNNNMGPKLLSQETQMPDLMPSMPLSSNASINGLSDFKSIPQELIPMPFKPMNSVVTGGMFSTSSGPLFGSPRGLSTSSASSLQLSSNSSSGFNYLQDNKNVSSPILAAGSAHMSATALLQKAAQMGATASNSSINSPMIQKSFGSSMASPHISHDQLSPVKQAQMQLRPINPAYDHHFQSQPSDHSSMVGIDGGEGGFNHTHKSQQEISHLFGPNGHDMGMYSQMFMNNTSSTTILEQEDSINSSSIHGKFAIERNTAGLSRFAETGGGGGGGSGSGNGDDDRIVVDFMGIGEPRPGSGMHEQQQQRLDHHQLEAMRQNRLPPMMNNHPFQQQVSHGDSGMEKSSIWGDV
ncbi:zinc finger protein GAI-ASSOCIATED FACTOR 1-like [Humulus lupulus]|uniref:zinc finger protein GAI-ASSOCIATED FACTOR 1-like n=1 Tax=Humulus lupulus TaxID=3486 RepID=UPI002B414CE7|nr:zinc finger protein GAI-ASSOCIATED FACTOR 1-like [Humulus lupulus]